MARRRGSQDGVDPSTSLDGCTLERYARVCRALVRAAPRTRQERIAELARHGFDVSAWDEVDRAWSASISSDEAVRRVFHVVYAGSETSGPHEIE